MTLIKKNKKGNILYCVVYLVLKKGQWESRTEYTHGPDAGSVRNTFIRALPHGFRVGKNVSITGIAPAIGYFIEKEGKGKIILSTD